VRVAGVEPALLSEQDFESSASTNSTTPAQPVKPASALLVPAPGDFNLSQRWEE
jgi:hypothetical protein